MRSVSRVLLVLALAAIVPLAVSGKTRETRCTTQMQLFDLCPASEDGKQGVLITLWLSTTDDRGSGRSSAELVQAGLCAFAAISAADCTHAAADRALRMLLREMARAEVVERRLNQPVPKAVIDDDSANDGPPGQPSNGQGPP